MKTGTSIIYRPDGKGEQQHGKVKDTITEFGSTFYLVLHSGGGLKIVKPRDIDIIEEDHERFI